MDKISFAAYHDLRRRRAENAQFDKELCEFRRRLEEVNEVDENYKSLLLLSEEEEFETHMKPKDRGDDCINEVDDSDGEIDPHYDLFLSTLKPHKKSYVIDGDHNGVPVLIKYEAETSSKEDEFEHNNSRMHAPEKTLIVYQRRKRRVVRQENEAITSSEQHLLNLDRETSEL